MRLGLLQLRGLTRFTGETPVSLNFNDLGPGLIALVGENGAGKTTAMEAVAAALYRRLPSRPGSVIDHAHGRDAFVVARLEENGSVYRARVDIDADKRRMVSVLSAADLDPDADYTPITDGKHESFDDMVRRLFGSEELFLSSIFAAQNRAGNFLEKKKTERKALFAEMLNLGHLQEMAEAARERVVGFNAAAATLSVKQQAMREQLAALESDGLPSIGEMEEDNVKLRNAVAGKTAALETLRDRRVTLKERVKRGEDLHARRIAATQRRDAAVETLGRLALKDRDGEMAHEMGGWADSKFDAEQKRRDESWAAREKALETDRQQCEAVIAEEQAIDAADSTVEQLKEKRARIVEQEHLLKRAGALRAQARLIEKVPCGKSPAWNATFRVETKEHMLRRDYTDTVDLAGTCPLLENAREAQKELQDPAFTRDVEEWTSDDQELMLRASAIAATRPRLIAAKASLERIAEEYERGEKDYRRALREIDTARVAAASARKRIRERYEEIVREDQETALRASKQRDDAEVEIAEMFLELEAIENHATHLARVEQEIERIGSDIKDLTMQLERGERDLATLRAKAEQAAALWKSSDAIQEELAPIDRDIATYSLLARALGRDGIQALEIDAAGPEVAGLANSLLDGCYGPRFSISFETLREKKSAPGEYTEVFDIHVFDAGRERPVEALSGGEKVIVGEAINLALAIYNANKSGVRWETLFRDETAGALDPTNAGRYIDMLRRARELGGFHQVIFVAHLPEVWERADARVRFTDGEVEVV